MPRGVAGRNTGLAWLRRHAKDGVAYFADDDNTYDIRLFTEVSIDDYGAGNKALLDFTTVCNLFATEFV